MNDNKRLAFCGIMTAVAAVLTLLINVLTFNTVFILVLLSLIISVITQKYGILWSGMSFVATTAIMLFVTWRYDVVIEYFLIFGSFPIIKYIIESKRCKIGTERLIKFAYTTVMSAVLTYVAIRFIGGAEFYGDLYKATEYMPYIIVAVTVIFWNAYDYLLTFAINYYNRKFEKK